MKPQDFRDWRKLMKLSQDGAASELGLNRSTVQIYERGARPDGRPFAGIPRHVALACRALFHRLAPWGDENKEGR